ncbi:crotonobetainyl-CoA:carnitine CoA-transferase CaiB-like acyl-CoA transferase [Streptomyces sp. B3I7]|uniref:CoA transferase n=1 Tax=Streptomyces sp. B3I7 TaxID=3042269 RepID=UPI00277D23FF|nr:CoA transferase [Streptomyces sp. B3I7]MDQ0809015.1 crotonobetainyl-CoA:carnitine CoA-transferase CaiB-like acyl-CoA transferase [Streptomyces sp. B3I7]
MTHPAPTGPPVAARVAGDLLALTGTPDAAVVACDIDWAGPLALALPEERAVQAACGLMHVHGRAGGAPAPLAVDYASTVAGVLAAQGVTAALLARARGAATRAVRTSVAQGALIAVAQYLAAATAGEERVAVSSGVGEPGSSTAEGRAPSPGAGDRAAHLHPPAPDDAPPGDPGAQPPGAGRAGAAGARKPTGTPGLISADGIRIELEALDAEPWIAFWRQLGAPSDAVRQGWRTFQTRFATAVRPLPPALAETVHRTPFTALCAAATASGASLLAVREDPAPPTAVPPWTLTPLAPGSAATPRPTTPTAPAEPLAGLRVVESTRRVQGPLAGHVLRLLGAEVVRVEPPGGDPMRGIPPLADGCSARFGVLNAGKTVVEADITTTAGRARVRDLVRDADVFLHNWAPGKAAHLRLDADDLARVSPALVYARASGWGEALGPRPPLGTDYLVQAHSGLAAALRPADEPPAPSLMTLTDVLGGLVCAQAVLTALLERLRTGRGQRADSSLYSAAALVPRGKRRARWGPYDRPLATGDGHLWLGPEARAHPERVARALGAGATADPAAHARTLRGAVLLPRLAAAGVPATPVCADLAALARDPRFAPALGTGVYAFPRAPWEFA